MTTAVLAPEATASRAPAAPIPTSRLVSVELRKMFDTRSGFWLMAAIVITAVLATGAVIAFAPEDAQNYGNFAAAIGMPTAVILPLVAALSVTSEWSQRSGLTTFTLVPDRGRVIAAKLLATLVVGVGSMAVALGVGALGNLLGSLVTGAPLVWGVGAAAMAHIVLGNILGMLMGFTLGVLVRSSAGAVVAYFVYSLVLPPMLAMLAAFQEWFRDLQPWVDFAYAQTSLYAGHLTGQQWQQLAVAGTLWLVLPLAAGLVTVIRSEVK